MMPDFKTLPAETIIMIDVLRTRVNAHPSWYDLEDKLVTDQEVLDFALLHSLLWVRTKEVEKWHWGYTV